MSYTVQPPCECGLRYFDKTSVSLEVGLAENRKNIEEGKINISKLAEHVWDDQCKIIEPSFMAVNDNCVSQPSKDVSRFWIRLLKEYNPGSVTRIDVYNSQFIV